MGQHERVCETLCNAAGFTKCWDADGVTPKYERCKAQAAASSEAVLLDVAWAIWKERGGPGLGDVVRALDNHNLRMVAGLLAALADGGIEGTEVKLWLQRYGPAARAEVTELPKAGSVKRGCCGGCGHTREAHDESHDGRRGACRKIVDPNDPTGRGVCPCPEYVTRRAAAGELRGDELIGRVQLGRASDVKTYDYTWEEATGRKPLPLDVAFGVPPSTVAPADTCTCGHSKGAHSAPPRSTCLYCQCRTFVGGAAHA